MNLTNSLIIMRRFVPLLFAALLPQLDALVLPKAVAPVRQLLRSKHQHPRSTEITSAAASDDAEEVKVTVRIKKPTPKDEGPPPSPVTLAIESTFVQAAGGMNGANYEFGLLEFVRAARDAFDEGIMVPALNLELSMCKQYTAGRPLQAEEIDLRTVWLSLVYLTFERVGYESKSAGAFPGQSVAAELRQKFYTFTYDVVNAKKQGYGLEKLKLEEVLQSDEEKTPMERAVLSQAMRICFLAIQAAEE